MSQFAALFREESEGGDTGEGKESRADRGSGAGQKIIEKPADGRAPSGFVGLLNQGATCYCNSLLQVWYMTPEVRGGLFALDPEDELHVSNIHVKGREELLKLKEKQPRKIALFMQKLFSTLQLSDKKAVSTHELTSEGFGWTENDVRIQHDLDSLYNVLTDALAGHLRKTAGEELLKNLFEVHAVRYTASRGLDPVYSSDRDSVEISLQVATQGYANLNQALDAYFSEEILEDDGKPVYCPDQGPYAGQRIPAVKGTRLKSLPPVLMISTNRVFFDMQKLQPVKNKQRFDLPLVLDMRRFMGHHDDESKVGTGNGAATVYPTDLITKEGADQAWARSQSTPDDPHVYDLFAIVIHHGKSANGGHYTAYIRDTLAEGNWAPPPFKMKGKKGGRRRNGAPNTVDVLLQKRNSARSPLRLILKILAKQPRDNIGRRRASVGLLGEKIRDMTGHKYKKEFPRKEWPSLKNFLIQCDDLLAMKGNEVFLKVNKEGYLGELEAMDQAAAIAESSGGNGNAEDDSQMTDEEKSLALAKKLAAEEQGRQGADKASSGGNDWTVVGGTRRGKPGSDKSKSSSSGSGGAGKEPAQASETKDSEDARRAEVQAKLAEAYYEREKCLADRWGHWFHFNDSKVDPILVDDLQNVAIGKDCSRMAVYRSRRLRNSTTSAAIAMSDGASATAAVDSNDADGGAAGGDIIPEEPGTFALTAPQFWRKTLDAENAELKARREAWELACNSVEVFVHTPSAYSVDSGGVWLSLSGNETPALSCEPINVPKKFTVAQMKQMLLDTFRDVDPQLPANAPDVTVSVVAPAGPAEKFHLFEEIGCSAAGSAGTDTNSESKEKSAPRTGAAGKSSWANIAGGKVKPMDPNEVMVGDEKNGIAPGTSLLLWDGTHINGVAYTPGPEHEPMHLSVSSITATATGCRATKETDLWLPKSRTLLELFTVIIDRLDLGTAAEDAVLHHIPTSGKTRKKYVRLDHDARADVSLSKLGLVQDSVLCVEIDVKQQRNRASYRPLAATFANKQVNKVDICVVDHLSRELGLAEPDADPQMHIVTVDKSEPVYVAKALAMQALGDDVRRKLDELFPRQNSFTATDDQQGEEKVAVSGGADGSTREGQGSDANDTEDLSQDPRVRMRVHRGVGLKVPVGPDLPPGVGSLFEEEDARWREYSEYDMYYLELGAPLEKQEIEIEVVVVTGNRKNAAGGGGSRHGEGLRHRAKKSRNLGAVLRDICSAAGYDGEDEWKHHRLRKVTKMGDNGHILLELDKPIAKMVEHDGVLMLEEGQIPQKGVVTLSLWMFVLPGEADSIVGPETLRSSSAESASQVDVSAKSIEADPFYRARQRMQQCVIRLSALDVKKSETSLLSLKEIVLTDPKLQQLAALRGITLEHAAQLRVRELDKKCTPRKIYKDNAKKLSGYKGINNKRLLVQLLPEPEQLSPNDITFFVQRRDLGSGENEPLWPAWELVFRTSAQPRLAALEGLLAGEGGLAASFDIPKQHLAVAKFFPKTMEWKQLRAKGSNQGRRKKRGRHRNNNLKSRYQLADGDLLAFADLRQLDGPGPVIWDRPEDVMAKIYMEQRKAEKSAGASAGKSSGRGKKPKRSQPVGDVQIHMDLYLGFSTDEENGEGDDNASDAEDDGPAVG